MEYSSSDDEEEILPPMRAQEEWADVVPLPVEDGGSTGSIRYMPDHAEALGYFRAILQQGERSKRALWLTERMLEFNSSDYTAWQWRWECLMALQEGWEAEYELCERIAVENVKNYQLWNHRRKCMLAIGEAAAERELQFAAIALANDAKNYHAWAHRQVVVKKFGLWKLELEFVDDLLREDVLNNSAWNQRMFVVRQTVRDNDARLVLDQELEYVTERIHWEPSNEASWAYLRGLFALPGIPPMALSRCAKVFEVCRKVLASGFSAQAADTLALYYGGLAAMCKEAGQKTDARNAAQLATELIARLAKEDPLRNNYWSFRCQELAKLGDLG